MSESTITFTDTVSRFGGYFATMFAPAGGTVTFYDQFNFQIGATQILTAPSCVWTWNGWDLAAASLPCATRIVIRSNLGNSSRVFLDDLEAEIQFSCGVTPTYYCVGDGSGNTCPCGNLNDGSVCFSGCKNSDFDSGCYLRVNSTSLYVGGAPQGTVGLFFRGDALIAAGNGIHFGEGLRCVGQGIVRLGIVQVDTDGNASLPHVPIPGKYYQYWFRDVPGVCTVEPKFNLSNAVGI